MLMVRVMKKKNKAVNPIDKNEPTIEGAGLDPERAGTSNSNFGPNNGDDAFGDNLDVVPNDKPTNLNGNKRKD